jgi:hypothetical protein
MDTLVKIKSTLLNVNVKMDTMATGVRIPLTTAKTIHVRMGPHAPTQAVTIRVHVQVDTKGTSVKFK